MATRRKFIRDCSALAASAALVPVSVLAAPHKSREVALAEVAFETLAAQVHARFLLRDANGDTQALEMTKAQWSPGSHSRGAGDGGNEKFSLLFRGDARQPLGQNTYALEQAGIGRFELFLVPVGGADGAHCYYEAVFNRPAPESREHRPLVAGAHLS
jgi:hypothetical protein